MYAPAAVDSLGRNALMVSSARSDAACVKIVAVAQEGAENTPLRTGAPLLRSDPPHDPSP